MSDESAWFAPKRYGYGSGLPVSWQGWVITLAYMVGVFGAVFLFRDRPYQAIAALIPLTAVFLVISAKTTRGGWRWRWGEDD